MPPAAELIDRDGERRRLLEVTTDAPALVVVRGRRRIGKSFLLSRSLDGARVIFFQADQQDQAGQLDLLAREAARLLPGRPPLAFPDWERALAFLGELAVTAPLTLVLDEFQYLCAAQPALPSILQRHWDRWQRQSVPVAVVLCGSALTFMQGLLDHGGPLFGRADYRPIVEPLDYRWTGSFAAEREPAALLRRYAVLGGTPQYQVWAGPGTLSEVIRERILTKGSPLYEEPLNLLRQEEGVRDPGTYFSVLRAIAEGATRTGEIGSRAGLKGPNATRVLDRLSRLGYIERREPLAPRLRDSRAVHRIRDPFFRFWFRYVFGNRSRLERERVDEVLQEIEADLDTYMGWAFEDCCREWVNRFAPEAEVGDSESVGSWWSRDGRREIDVVGMKGRRYVVLGSCKWRRRVDRDVLDQLYEHRAGLGGPAVQARLALFAREGFTDRVSERARQEGVLLVSAADLFSAGQREP